MPLYIVGTNTNCYIHRQNNTVKEGGGGEVILKSLSPLERTRAFQYNMKKIVVTCFYFNLGGSAEPPEQPKKFTTNLDVMVCNSVKELNSLPYFVSIILVIEY